MAKLRVLNLGVGAHIFLLHKTVREKPHFAFGADVCLSCLPLNDPPPPLIRSKSKTNPSSCLFQLALRLRLVWFGLETWEEGACYVRKPLMRCPTRFSLFACTQHVELNGIFSQAG